MPSATPSINIEALLSGDRRTLAKAITLVESSRSDDRAQATRLVNNVLPHTGKSIRLGISGVPGVGKSTFIESFGLNLVEASRKLAVLAVDPSSPLAGGSILGDKTRMEDLSRHSDAFIRPSPSAGALGGVAQTTRETMLLCEAAGFDTIVVETVGVGQSEYDVAHMVDFFLVLMMPNAGDDLQGIKRGIMELVDALVINKADGDSISLAKQSRQHYRNAFHLLRSEDGWKPEVHCCSALNREGIVELWQMIERYFDWSNSLESGIRFKQKRSAQNLQWMKQLLHAAMDLQLKNNKSFTAERKRLEAQVLQGQITPLSAVESLLQKI